MKYRIRKYVFVMIILLPFFVSCEQEKSWVMKIEGEKISLADFESSYEAFLGIQAQSLQITPEELKKFIKNPETAPDQNARAIFENLKKENFFDNYKATLLVNLEAKKENFTKKTKNSKRLAYAYKYFIANFYMEETIPEKNFKVKKEEVLEEVEKIRREDPRYRRVPLNQITKIVERRLKQIKKQEVINKLLTGLIEKYKIEENDDLINKIKAKTEESAAVEEEKTEKIKAVKKDTKTLEE